MRQTCVQGTGCDTSTVQGSSISITSQSLDTTTLGIENLNLQKEKDAGDAVSDIATAITLASSKVSTLGSSLARLDAQSKFITDTIDILETEVGNQVNADLTAETAQLTALQIQQQIAVQALAIANASPQNLLALFSLL